MIFKNLSALILLLISGLSFGDDIIGSDDRRPLTASELNSYSFVGRLHVNTLTRWQGWQDIPRCSVTLVSEKVAVTDANCFVQSSLLSREEVANLKTQDDYINHFIKHNEDFSVVFSSPEYKRVSIRSIHFSNDYKPAQNSKRSDHTHIFNVQAPSGNPLLILDLETRPNINPIHPFIWENGRSLKEDVKISAISFDRDNETLLIDDNCAITNNFEDKTGFKLGTVFQNNCDDISLSGSPVVLTTENGTKVLRGLNISGAHLSGIVKNNPNLSQSEIFELEDKGCGDLSPDCVNTGIAANTISNRLEQILPTFKLLDSMSDTMEVDCAARVTFNHIVKRLSISELFLLCSRDEILSLGESKKAPFHLLKEMAKKEELVLSGGQIPENFSMNDVFYKEVLAKKSFNIFQKLFVKNLLSEEQQLAFMKESPETISAQFNLFGSDSFKKKLNLLASNRSPLFRHPSFWSFMAEKKISINEIKNLSLSSLVKNHKVSYSTLKNYYSVEEFKKYFSYRELVNEVGMSHQELISSGVKYKDYVYYFSASILRDNGGGLSNFKSSGISVYNLIREKFLAQEIKTAGFMLSEVISASSAQEARKLGYELKEFKSENIEISQIEKAFSAKEVREAYSFIELLHKTSISRLKDFYGMTPVDGLKNFSSETLYPTYSINELMAAGATLKNIRSLFCTKNSEVCTLDRPYYSWSAEEFLKELGKTNSTPAALYQAGFSTMVIFFARHSLKDVKSLNRPIREYYKDWFSVAELVVM
ncbi:MAG: hypothetical protein ACOVP4_06360, partial [Bacteriovoracaceae bacterium]